MSSRTPNGPQTPSTFAAGNDHGLILYDYATSPCARRCRITLIEKGLVWETETIDLSRLEQRNPEYLKINPNGFVPTLAHGERVIYESNVITEYLDDAFPETRLYPSDPWQLAQVKMWQSAEAAMAKDFRTLMYQRLMGPLVRLTRTLDEALAAASRSTTDPADLMWEERVWRLAVLTPEEEAQHEDRLLKWLEILERRLQGREFLVGDRFTQAEVSVYPRLMMYAFLQLRPSRDRFPNIARWMDRLKQRPSFVRTLSDQDRGLLRLARTPVLPWLHRTLAKPEGARSWSGTLGLSLARRVARRALGGADAAPGGAASPPRAIRRPRNGAIPPGGSPVAPLSRASDALRRQPIVLYDYTASPHARRIRILLREKGLAWRTVPVDMSRMSHKAPEYLSINPNGELPALRHGDRVLYDSQAIAEYLDRIYADDAAPRLYPVGAFAVAQVRMWLALEAGTHKEFRPLFYSYFVRRDLLAAGITADQVDEIVPSGVHPSHKDWLRDTIEGTLRFDTNEELSREIITRKLDFMEEHLRGREYLVGDEFTMADVAWYTRIDTFAVLRIPVAPDRHPHVSRWYGTVGRRPSVAGGD